MAKITAKERDEMIRLYVFAGWRIMHLARKYGIAHTSVIHHIKDQHRKSKPIEYCPDEIAEKSAHVQRLKQNRPKGLKVYEDYLREEEERRRKKRQTCGHKELAIICICCGQHLEETKNQKAKAVVTFI